MLHLLPDEFLNGLINQYLSSVEVKTLRLVSKDCRSFVNRNTNSLKPRAFVNAQVTISVMATIHPSVPCGRQQVMCVVAVTLECIA